MAKKNTISYKNTTNLNLKTPNPLDNILTKLEKFDYIPFIIYTIILLFINLVNHKVGDYGVETDFFWMYVPEAKKILSGTLPIDQFRGPFYPIMLAIFKLFIGDFFKAGIILNTIAAGITLYFFDKTLKLLYNRFVAFFTTLFIAFNPVFLQYTYSCGTDMLFLSLVSLTIYFVFSKTKFNLYFAGLFAGLSYLTRYNGIFLIIGTILFFIFNLLKTKDYKSILLDFSKFTIVFLIIILPWGIYTKIEKGEFFYNQNYLNTAFEFQENKVSWDEYWQGHKNIKSTYDVFSQNPTFFTQKVFSNLYRNFILDTHRLIAPANLNDALQYNENNLETNFLAIILILSFILYIYFNHLKGKIGSFKWIFEIENPEKIAFLTFLILDLLILTLIFYSERFNLFLLLFYGLILFSTIDNLTLKFKLVGIIISTIFCIYTLSNAYNYNKDIISSGPEEIILASDWINNNNLPKSKIIARKPHIAYYTNMKFEVIPVFKSPEEFAKKLNQTDAQYLFVSAIEVNSRPFLQYILSDSDLRKFPELSQKLTILTANDYPFYVIYKINK
ncbi:MAG TPA: glycosyltransferase family 39 protein [Ignavibacteriales bacterium]|nr:glycosyltransferase family 39 protein [Ignavibacteriales bacterium]HOL80947.1 glycosyltransferase family 39 protein [Ignavibacteriales bacterium]HOM64683.1 glycosyltransferase family 39 protein [Ignavibacteriales bacterium]HPD66786.1 glycosyltransferase family 39 protein [Ignavibacteriales bacterium]HPP32728.1 glycosyltransferase family 39 protein [Ignavibacteriales bacterium]